MRNALKIAQIQVFMVELNAHNVDLTQLMIRFYTEIAHIQYSDIRFNDRLQSAIQTVEWDGVC